MTPNPHNIPNKTAKNPSSPQSAQHHGAQQPFFKGGSTVKGVCLY
jgi:hypothetical protein